MSRLPIEAFSSHMAHSFASLPISLVVVLLTFVGSIEQVRAAAPDVADAPAAVRDFLSTHCYDCHEGAGAEAGLDLASLSGRLDDPTHMADWVRIYDRVHDGEMPPEDASMVEPEEAAAFLGVAGKWLRQTQQHQHQTQGRSAARRLTSLQLEGTLHDLLGIDVPLASQMPEDPRQHGFTTAATAQGMSHFQIERHLMVVDAALDEAFRRALDPDEDEWTKELPAKELARTRKRTREPELIDGRIVTWSSGLIFYGRLPATTAREDGWYRFTVRGAQALKAPDDRGVWCSVRSGPCVSSAPLLSWIGAFEATDEPKEVTFEAWLPKGHMLEIRPGDTTLKKGRFAGGQVANGEGEPQDVPGVAIESMTLQRIHRGPSDDAIRQRLFGELEIDYARRAADAKLISAVPREDAARLLKRFALDAFRRPVDDAALTPYVELVQQAIDDGDDLIAALRSGYRAVLCSPRFLYFQESPGSLDDYAIASRLSYLLWNSMPDAVLLRLAEEGRLTDSDVIHKQVERMLDDPRGEAFMDNFADQWLDLSEIDATEPDRRLYPDFDQIVQHAMLAETQTFLQTMLRDDLSVTTLLDAEYTFLNSRLARYYGIDGIEGDQLQRVDVDPEDHRGGLLTQGAILKVTANGTNTSPVIRGVWVCDRLLGQPIPPPPESVPAIEPDVRGATTIRELLAKHRSDDSCAVCHVKIDPPGFALENYDAAGRWRERYGQLDTKRRGKGAVIDASYTLPDGREFENFDQFRQLIVAEPERLARGFAEKLITYGTGAPVGFADRLAVAEIVDRTADADYGLRSLLHAVVTSPLFLSK